MDYHQPVLVSEVLQTLEVSPGKIYIDGTVGNGGHSLEILKLGGIVYGFDLDPINLKIAADRISSAGYSHNFFPINRNFTDLSQINQPVSGLLLDLGLSSGQLKSPGRGFSYDDPDSLDMRLNPEIQTETAENIINTAPYEDLYDIFTKYAQEKFAKPLIIRIISERQKQPIKNGQRLAAIIRSYYQQKHLHSKIDPSTKIFMALRIAVNQEFTNLKTALDSTLKLTPGCIVAVITFHSGEDRIVKQFIRNHFSHTPKPIFPSQKEIRQNPLARSAILRSYRII